MTIHNYQTTLAWNGSTGEGYRSYPRTHSASAAGADSALSLSADPAFRGDASLLNPEQLLVIAASSCQLLSFLAVAAQHGLDVLSYDDHGEAEMNDQQEPVGIETITLRPTIRVAAGTDTAEVLRLVEVAHSGCYIANSLAAEVDIIATVVEG